MKIIISCTLGDAKILLEKVGITSRASPFDGRYYVEIKSLDDLLYLTELLECDLIVGTDRHGVLNLRNNEPFIEIYNRYRE